MRSRLTAFAVKAHCVRCQGSRCSLSCWRCCASYTTRTPISEIVQSWIIDALIVTSLHENVDRPSTNSPRNRVEKNIAHGWDWFIGSGATAGRKPEIIRRCKSLILSYRFGVKVSNILQYNLRIQLADIRLLKSGGSGFFNR